MEKENKKCGVRIASPNDFTRIKEVLDRDGNVIKTEVQEPKKQKNGK